MNLSYALVCVANVFIAMYQGHNISACVRTKENQLRIVLAEECRPETKFLKSVYSPCGIGQKNVIGNFLHYIREKCVCIGNDLTLITPQNNCLLANAKAFRENFERIEKYGAHLAQKELIEVMDDHKRRGYKDFLVEGKALPGQNNQNNLNKNRPVSKNHPNKKPDPSHEITKKNEKAIQDPAPPVPKNNAQTNKEISNEKVKVSDEKEDKMKNKKNEKEAKIEKRKRIEPEEKRKRKEKDKKRARRQKRDQEKRARRQKRDQEKRREHKDESPEPKNKRENAHNLHKRREAHKIKI